MNYYIKTEQMNVGYGEKPVINNIDLKIKKGEIWTLIGPNGSGKSTLLKSIAKQLKPLGGTMYLDNKDLTEIKTKELSKKMSVVFTEKIKAEMMSCEDIVATGRYPYTGIFGLLSDKDHQVVDEAMKLVHVFSIRNRDFDKISDGQRQRVMLARAICQEPEIILLDEPTSFLDIKYKLEFLSILQELQHKKNLTVIMSLHELDLAQRVSDKIICLNGKCVDKIGRPQEIFKKDYITHLFDIHTGIFDEENGCAELEAVRGEAKVFVIAGGGCGRGAYRQLQRKRIPFVSGIIYKNDVDYPVAAALASEVITAEEFEPVKDEVFKTAKKRMDKCDRVICCKESFKTFEKKNEELLEYAKKTGKIIESW